MARCVWHSAVLIRAGHVVRTFGFVDIALAVFGRDFLEKLFKVRLNVGIGIFLNARPRCGGRKSSRGRS
jgi:hypothetical protein